MIMLSLIYNVNQFNSYRYIIYILIFNNRSGLQRITTGYNV